MRFSEQEDSNSKYIKDVVPLTGAHGFDVENPTIREQPIGRLDRQYSSTQLRNSLVAGSVIHVRGGVSAPPPYTRIPPLAILDQFWDHGTPLARGATALRSVTAAISRRFLLSWRWFLGIASVITAAAVAVIRSIRQPIPNKYSATRGAYSDWETVSVHITSRLLPVLLLALLIILLTVFNPFRSSVTRRNSTGGLTHKTGTGSTAPSVAIRHANSTTPPAGHHPVSAATVSNNAPPIAPAPSSSSGQFPAPAWPVFGSYNSASAPSSASNSGTSSYWPASSSPSSYESNSSPASSSTSSSSASASQPSYSSSPASSNTSNSSSSPSSPASAGSSSLPLSSPSLTVPSTSLQAGNTKLLSTGSSSVSL